MAQFVEFPLKNGGHVVVETDEPIAGPIQAGKSGEIAGRAKQTFEEALAGIGPIVQAISKQLEALASETTAIELGIKFSTEVGIVLTKAASEGTCKVTLTWKKGA